MTRLPVRGGTMALLLIVLLGATHGSVERARAQMAPRDQLDPDITFLADRQELLVVWSEDRGSGHRLYAKRVRPNGIPVGGPSAGEWEATRQPADRYGAPPSPLGDQRWPALIDGLLVYSEKASGGTDYDLYAQRLYSNGRPSGAPRMISGGAGDQLNPDVAILSRGGQGGEFLVVWSEDSRDAGDVMGIRIDHALRRSRGAAFPVAQGPGTAEDPTIARDLLDSKTYLVLFTDDRKGNRDIYGTRLTESGLPRGGPLGGHFPVVDSPEDDYAPAIVTSLEESGLGPTPTPNPRDRRPRDRNRAENLLLWTTDHVTDGPNVLAHRLSENGLPTGTQIEISSGPGVQAWPAATLMGLEEEPGASRQIHDEWLAIWTDNALGTLDVVSARLGTNGIVRSTHRVLASD